MLYKITHPDGSVSIGEKIEPWVTYDEDGRRWRLVEVMSDGLDPYYRLLPYPKEADPMSAADVLADALDTINGPLNPEVTAEHVVPVLDALAAAGYQLVPFAAPADDPVNATGAFPPEKKE